MRGLDAPLGAHRHGHSSSAIPGCDEENGSAADALAYGGNTPPNTAATEEFTGETTTANIENFTTS